MTTVHKDFILTLPSSEVMDVVYEDNWKRRLQNAEPWLSDFCKDDKLLKREYLEASTVRIIEFFSRIMMEENRSIHDYASCKFLKIDRYHVEIIFRGYRFD